MVNLGIVLASASPSDQGSHCVGQRRYLGWVIFSAAC